MSSLTVPIPPDLSPACRAGNTDLETDPSAGLAEGRRLASWYRVRPEIEAAGGTWIDELVVQDGNFFTARKPGDLPVELRSILAHLRNLEEQRA